MFLAQIQPIDDYQQASFISLKGLNLDKVVENFNEK
jgi:hypothetical protein